MKWMRNLGWLCAFVLIGLLNGCDKHSSGASAAKAIRQKFYWVQPMKAILCIR